MLEPQRERHLATVEGESVVPWGGGAATVALLSVFAAYIVGSVLVATAWHAIASGSASREGLEIGIFSYQFLTLGTAASAILLCRRYAANPIALGFRFPGWTRLFNSALVVIPVFAGVALLYFLFTTFLPGYHLQGNAKQLLSGTTGHLNIGEKVGLFVFAAIEAPLTEETLFRGVLYQGLRETVSRWLPRYASVAVAAVMSGLIFGALHFEPQTLPILAFLGIVLALVFQFGKSIYSSMIVHAIVNALAVISLIQTS